LSDVLHAVSRQTGIEVAGAEGLRGPIFTNFDGVELEKALQALLGGLNYVVVKSPLGSASPREWRVIIIRDSVPDLKQAGSRAGASPIWAQDPRDISLKEIDDAAAEKDKNTLRRHIQDTDPGVLSAAFEALVALDKDVAISNLVTSMQNNASAEARLCALRLLVESGYADEQLRISAWRDALGDHDPSIVAYAIQSLASLFSPSASEALMDALQNSDPSVRLLVISSVGAKPTAIPLLRQALSDSDERVSSAAAALLKQADPSGSSGSR
jgi:hypothetical protein